MSHARSVLKNLVPVLVLCVCAILLWPQLSNLDTAKLSEHWRAIGLGQWLGAAILTALSFWAVSHYDVLAHRQLDTKTSKNSARTAGLAAIALAQTTGFGLIVGTLVRWRLLRPGNAMAPAQITGFVSLMFMAALTALAALLCLFLPAPTGFTALSIVALAGVSSAAIFAIAQPRLWIGENRIDLPSLKAMSQALGWAALDVLAASAAFYFLFPAGFAPDIAAFLPVFCLALAAGLFSGTPCGVGPFELVFLGYTSAGMAAETDLAAALTAIAGFRLIYFAIPAVLACAFLALSRRDTSAATANTPRKQMPPARAESGVVHQSGGAIEDVGGCDAALWPTGQALVCLFDPFSQRKFDTFLPALKARAAARNRSAFLYKGQQRTALAARVAGWSVLHIADDAIVDLPEFTLDTPARARLRRKLRKASKGDITFRAATAKDFDDLADIDVHWQADHGQARGGTMGRFCTAYLARQAIFVAQDSTRLLGFVSFHRSSDEWALDLMRHRSNLPDGIMQALVMEGIKDAQTRGVARMSLSAVPACPDPDSAFWRWVSQKLVLRAGGTGLRQFKSAFGPRWIPLYAAAPSRIALTVGLFDIARAVVFPGKVQRLLVDTDLTKETSSSEIMNTDHNDDEYYEVASTHIA